MIRLSTYMDIIDEIWGLGSKVSFVFNDIKSPENFIFAIQFVKKYSICGVLANFSKTKISFGDYFHFQSILNMYHWICLAESY